MSIAWDSDVTLTVTMGFGIDPYATTGTWTDVSAYIHTVSFTRGSTPAPTPNVAAGTCTVVFDNDDGRFDPNNTSSPYYPDVTLTVGLKITATVDTVQYPLYVGYVTGYTVDYPEFGKRSTVTVDLVDVFQLFNQFDLTDYTYPRQSTDERIGAVLDDVGWPAAWRTFDSGVTEVAALTDGTGVTALTHLQQVATAEAGTVFLNNGGNVEFHNRVHHSGGGTSKGTFGPSDMQPVSVEPLYDADFLYNRVVVTGDFVTTSSFNQTSIDKNRERILPIDGAAMSDTNAAKNVAQWNVRRFKDMLTRVASLVVMPQKDAATMWPIVLDLDLYDAILVKTEPPGGGTALSQLVNVTGVSCQIGLDTWTVTYQCLPLTTVETDTYWVIGTSKIGTETRLA